MDLKQKVVKGLIWSATQNWGRLVIVFFILLVLSRLLEPKDFGLMALGTVFIAFAKIFLDQ
ncbi:MAG: oligosaccharide flippase family protein, partial [candidate division Zixibacteria bacterium]|nr:oligosaccharide flippase family protein [candidate division Zixibacteria bacterium]